MCGRYTLTKEPTSISDETQSEIRFESLHEGEDLEFKPRYNIAPTQMNPVVRKRSQGGGLALSEMRWGLVPSWSRTGETPSLMINARSETVAEKPSFKAAYQRRRCLIPADGYYEWKRQRSVNQPYYMQLADESVFYMAGIWESWLDSSGKTTESYAILTTQANTIAAKVHDRMPVILLGGSGNLWLEGGPKLLETDKRFDLFAPIDSDRMQCRPVNPIVNNNQNDTPECISEPPVEASTQLDMGF